MDILTNKAGRFIFALPFGVFGIFHLMNASNMAGYVPAFIPGGVFWVYLTGIAHLAACISFIIEKKAHLAGLLLALMLLIFALTIHLPGALEGDAASTTNFLKDFALSGGALILADRYSADKGSNL